MQLRQRVKVVMHMVIGFVVMILLAQLWLFTVTLDAMENGRVSTTVAIVALLCSFGASAVVWAMIRLLLKAENNQ
jgi:hypothetical protein